MLFNPHSAPMPESLRVGLGLRDVSALDLLGLYAPQLSGVPEAHFFGAAGEAAAATVRRSTAAMQHRFFISAVQQVSFLGLALLDGGMQAFPDHVRTPADLAFTLGKQLVHALLSSNSAALGIYFGIVQQSADAVPLSPAVHQARWQLPPPPCSPCLSCHVRRLSQNNSLFGTRFQRRDSTHFIQHTRTHSRHTLRASPLSPTKHQRCQLLPGWRG